MKVVLIVLELPLAEAWERYCGDLDFVSVYHGSIFDVECQAVVSPANSAARAVLLLWKHGTIPDGTTLDFPSLTR